MAPTVAKPDAKSPAGKKAGKKTDEPKKKIGRPRNYDLGNGVYRFSRSRMYHKKALWKFIGKKTEPKKKVKKPLTIVKQIGGEKNGGTRVVLLKKRRNYYPTQDKIKKRPTKKCFKQHKRSLKSSLTPGTVCILLAGRHKGKRVVFLKQLHTGLLLVTGPFLLNACPLRRVSQRYVIGTETKIDISKVTLPEQMNDKYFRRERRSRPKKGEEDIFATKKVVYKVSDERKKDQKIVDKQVLAAIKARPDKKVMYAYLARQWSLNSTQFPHRMKF